MLRTKDHVLSPEMEGLLASAGEVLGGAATTFGMFNNADLVFPEITDDKGEKVRITHGRYRVLLENPDVRVRKDMFENYYKMFIDYKNTLAANYQTHVTGHVFQAKARKYASALERGVDINNVPVQVYKNLLEGLLVTDPKMLDLAKVFEMKTSKKIKYIYLPSLSPHIKSAISLAIGMAFRGGITAEVVGQPVRSIGNGLYRAKINLATSEMLAWTLVAVLAAFLIERLISFIVKKVLK